MGSDTIFNPVGDTIDLNELAVGTGTAGQVAKVNAGATAMEWGTAGSVDLIEKITMAGTALTATFSTLGTHDYYMLVYRTTAANPADIDLTFNADAGANYNYQIKTIATQAITSVAGGTKIRLHAGANASVGLGGLVNFFREASGGRHFVQIICGESNGTSEAISGAAYVSATAISSLTLTSTSGNLTGIAELWGFKSS